MMAIRPLELKAKQRECKIAGDMRINHHLTKSDKIAFAVGVPILALLIFLSYENAVATSNFFSFYLGFLGMFTCAFVVYFFGRRAKNRSVDS